ncbi:MAG: sulfatase [Phycisphaerales bacterium]|nr:MAG: sulfatase [Phycisphaerales bacterium]
MSYRDQPARPGCGDAGRFRSEVRRRNGATGLVGAAMVLLLVRGSWAAPPGSMDQGRTNVLWLTICTLRADHLGAYGYPYETSPVIDALAWKGVLFERALTPAPWTRPSVAAAITGLYPRSLNIDEPANRFNRRRLHEKFLTLAEILKGHGYYTVGITANPNTNAVFNFDQGYDYYEDTGDYVFWLSQQAERKRIAEQVNAAFLHHLCGPGKGKKFFAHLVYVDVHQPLLDRVIDGKFPELELALKNTPVPRYDRQIRYVDTQTGRLLEQLKEMGLEDTLVVITSDHGEAFGLAHPEDKWHGRALYNAAIWVPFILYHPSLEQMVHRRPERVDLACIAPTIVDLLGIEHEFPANGATSLRPLIEGRGGRSPFSHYVIETFFEEVNMQAVLWSDWKLIVNHPSAEDGKPSEGQPVYELYQFEKDRQERENTASARPYQVRQMLGMLAEWERARPPLVPAEEIEVEVGTQIFEDLKALGYID